MAWTWCGVTDPRDRVIARTAIAVKRGISVAPGRDLQDRNALGSLDTAGEDDVDLVFAVLLIAVIVGILFHTKVCQALNSDGVPIDVVRPTGLDQSNARAVIFYCYKAKMLAVVPWMHTKDAIR